VTGDTTVQLIWFVAAFVLVGSALAARRINLADGIKMALAWIAIFGLVFLAIWTFQMARGG
jgi:cyanate permease